MAKRKRYTDEFRASAVLMLEAAGYPDKEGALTKVAKHLGMPYQTLSRWAREKNNPPPPELVHNKKIDLIAGIKNELSFIFDEMGKTRQDAEYRELATAFGIMVDKLQLLTGQPTERNDSRILFERTGLSTIPEHLAPGTIERGGKLEAIQRPGMRAPVG